MNACEFDAWRAIRNDENLRITFERIAKKAGRKKAILGDCT
jgi:hypothetical protein